jgi:hypothetical protein
MDARAKYLGAESFRQLQDSSFHGTEVEYTFYFWVISAVLIGIEAGLLGGFAVG